MQMFEGKRGKTEVEKPRKMAEAWLRAGQDQQAVSDKIRVVISVLQTTGEPAAQRPRHEARMKKITNKQTQGEKKKGKPLDARIAIAVLCTRIKSTHFKMFQTFRRNKVRFASFSWA